MRTLLAALAAFFVICSGGWGPITHLEIAEMQGGTSHDYRAGCLLPDFSLAYRTGYDTTYPNLQSVTHSQGFRDALAEVASDDFLAGWDSHLYADTIESPYSKAKIAEGAPCGADYVVDQAYDQEDNCPEMQSGYISDRYVKWINYALDKVGCETDYPPKHRVGYAYRVYISGMYQPNKRYYKQVLDEWYSDYQEYVDRAANLPPPPEPEPPIPPVLTPPEPKPKIANRTPRPWYSYEAPPERAEAERLKAEKWAEIGQAMRATDDIAEKLRLYAEWEIFRDRHNTPSRYSFKCPL